MNYNEQRGFLKEYRAASVAFAAVAVSIEVAQYLINGKPSNTWQIALNVTLTFALLYAIIYLPKYLHLTIESQKKYSWSVRIRWILIPVALLCGLLVANERAQYQALLTGTAILLGTNTAVRYWVRRQRSSSQRSHWIGTFYALSDGMALYLIFQALKPDLISQIVICGLAAHLAIQLDAALLALGFLGGINIDTTPGIVLYLVFAAASYTLTFIARRRNEQNLDQTITELAAFTGENRDTVEQLLATSTGKLAADWHHKQPEGKEAVGVWYQENSESYIYDLAQYHLAYKHIVFSLDVMSLARGRVLDYGAGIGDLALALAERGHAVTYFDVEGKSKQYASWQAERRNLKLLFASAHAELEQESFDTIIVLDVLEHLFEPEQVLEFLLGKLSDGGIMIVSAYFGATKAHPMHLDHRLDVAAILAAHGLNNAKGIYLRFLGSEAMRRRQMFVYRKWGDLTTKLTKEHEVDLISS